MNAFPPPPADAPRRPRGRPPSRSWTFFTTIVETQKQPSAVCRHCNQLIHHRQKWAQARAHLMKCPQFRRLMDTIPANEIPEWYLAEINRRQNLLDRSKTATMNGAPGFQNQIPTQLASAFKMIQPVSMAGAMMVPISMDNREKMAAVDVEKVEEKVAMHLFTTVAVEKLVEEDTEFPFLLQVVQTCNPNLTLPNKKKLMTELLDRCFENVKRRVGVFLQSGLVPVTLSFDVAPLDSENNVIVSYMASSEKYPIYLESIKAPSCGGGRIGVEWSAKDVARVVGKLSCNVAGCVMPCSSLENQRTRELLEEQFPSMYFHGCMRDALWSLVVDIFTAGGAKHRNHSMSLSFVRDLQQLALQCKDLEFFLPPQAKRFDRSEAIESRTSIIHVTVRRRLTVEEAFFAILEAEPFLDTDDSLDQLFPSGSNGNDPDGLNPSADIAHLQTQLIKIVRSSQFGKKLRKFLEVLRPVYTLLEALGDGTGATSLLLSEVHSSFSQLAQQFASSTLLQSEEKEALQALVREQQDKVLGPAHLLACLLDPVLLGEDLPADTKTDAEQKLMSSLRADGTPLSDTDKDALHAQYMEFKQSALNQKTDKTVVFCPLKERKTSPFQFWVVDGTKWPVLQAIACRIFVVPVCAASSARVVSGVGVALRTLREKTTYLASDKLAYVRVNTHQLNMAEVVGNSLVTGASKSQDESNANDITASMVV